MARKKLNEELEYRERDIVRLEQVESNLPADNRKFANSLLRQYRTKGYLSGKQWYWVQKLGKEVDVPKGDGPRTRIEQSELSIIRDAERSL